MKKSLEQRAPVISKFCEAIENTLDDIEVTEENALEVAEDMAVATAMELSHVFGIQGDMFDVLSKIAKQVLLDCMNDEEVVEEKEN